MSYTTPFATLGLVYASPVDVLLHTSEPFPALSAKRPNRGSCEFTKSALRDRRHRDVHPRRVAGPPDLPVACSERIEPVGSHVHGVTRYGRRRESVRTP